MKLYKITTKNDNTFWCLALDPTEAMHKVEAKTVNTKLKQNRDGYEIKTIEIIADSVMNFSNNSHLIFP